MGLLVGAAGRTSWTKQLDGPAGRTSWTDQLDKPAGQTSWADQLFLFETLASSHIRRSSFQFVHCPTTGLFFYQQKQHQKQQQGQPQQQQQPYLVVTQLKLT